MPTIRILPPEVVNRIAAGEVVERPASVVRELVENSIDASATDIAVDLEDGGKGSITVRDNGTGIGPEDLPLAFASHATSKLSDADLTGNLLGVTTLGFRGEALASIASVAVVELTSRTHGAEHAFRFRPGAGRGDDVFEPAAGDTGTVIVVRNLFHNTPGRRKFLRSTTTELAHATEHLTRLALAHPDIRFRLSHGRKPVLDLPPVSDLGERLRQVAGKEVSEGLLRVREGGTSSGLLSLTGFVGEPRLHRKDSQAQNFFVNGRWVRDRVLSGALRAAYQGFQIPGKHPIAYLFLQFPAGDVDANVHPTKTEVRFRDPSDVYRLVHHAVRAALDRRVAGEGGAGGPAPAADLRSGIESAAFEYFANPPAERTFHPAASPRSLDPGAASPRPDYTRPAARANEPQSPPSPASFAETLGEAEKPKEPRAFQVLDSYIVIETPEGIMLLDQHAFHEKILFEEIFRRVRAGVAESQRLLVPEVVELPAALMPLLETVSGLLGRLGFEVEAFGPSSVAIRAFPALFDRETGTTRLQELVRSAFEVVLAGDEVPGAAEDPLHGPLYGIASTMACKRAVKAGMPLSDREIRRLLERGALAADPRHCPHGRPTSILLSRRDIERQFDRR